eukprot:3595572-Rhodomonas_salina.2
MARFSSRRSSEPCGGDRAHGQVSSAISYALHRQCPVLASRVLLYLPSCARDAVSGTDLAYAATCPLRDVRY